MRSQAGGSPHARAGTGDVPTSPSDRYDAKQWISTSSPPIISIASSLPLVPLNEKWTGDITAIWTYEGWLYLAVVLDLFSRRVVEWAMAVSADERLVEMALRMALQQLMSTS